MHSDHCSSSSPVSPPSARSAVSFQADCAVLPKRLSLGPVPSPSRSHFPVPFTAPERSRCHWNSSSQCPQDVHATVSVTQSPQSSHLTHRQQLEPDTAPPPFHRAGWATGSFLSVPRWAPVLSLTAVHGRVPRLRLGTSSLPLPSLPWRPLKTTHTPMTPRLRDPWGLRPQFQTCLSVWVAELSARKATGFSDEHFPVKLGFPVSVGS